MIAHAPTENQSHVDDEGRNHVVSVRLLVTVFLTLVLLTLLTVLLAGIPSGPWEIWISLGIASLKAALVAAYFMHLRFDNPFNTVILLSTIGFVALFLILTLADSRAYQPELHFDQLPAPATAPE